MSLLIAVLIGLLALAASRAPSGRLWRILVAASARFLNVLTWRRVAVVVLTIVFLQLLAQLAMPHLAVVLAVDVVGWIEVFAATLIVTRLLPGWHALKGAVGRGVQTIAQARPRAWRVRRIRGPAAKPADDPDPAWGLVFA